MFKVNGSREHETMYMFLLFSLEWILMLLCSFLTVCVGHLENIGSLSDANVPNVDSFYRVGEIGASISQEELCRWASE